MWLVRKYFARRLPLLSTPFSHSARVEPFRSLWYCPSISYNRLRSFTNVSSQYINMEDGDQSPDGISLNHFKELLGRYPSLIETISSEKALKPGQPSLLELDEFRYGAAVNALKSSKPEREITHDDVKKLVAWKLSHGKFRPTLMKLVSSNDGEVVQKTMQKAMEQYWSDEDALKAMAAIASLKGIGPATASLILSVHDPERVIFFSDEAFRWLCCYHDKKKPPIKYHINEYKRLMNNANELAKRLEVGAMDIERVVYVIEKGKDLQFTPNVGWSKSS